MNTGTRADGQANSMRDMGETTYGDASISTPNGGGAWNGAKWVRRSTRLAIHLRDRFSCVYCQRSLTRCNPRHITLDHVTPRHHFGTNAPNNLVTACKHCNDTKQAQTVREFAGADAVRRVRNATRRVLPRALARALLAEHGTWRAAKRAGARR